MSEPEINEELVEEVATILEAIYEEGIDDEAGLEPSHPLSSSLRDLSTKDIARQIIALIGKAYLKGMPLPREERRMDIGDLGFHERYLWFEQAMKSGATTFIALRQEKGGDVK